MICDLYEADALEMGALLSGRNVRLVLGSPPYVGKGERYPGSRKPWTIDDWVPWMLTVIRESLRVAPVCVFVVNDPFRAGRYIPAVPMLEAEAYREGLYAERPLTWSKNAPPNRKDWWGNGTERILAFKRAAAAVPTFNWETIATPPKYKNGGHFRQRDDKGKRRKGGDYPTGPLTRPNDLIQVMGVDSLSVIDILEAYENLSKASSGQILRTLWEAIDRRDLPGWWAGIVAGILKAAVLQQSLQRAGDAEAGPGEWGSGERPEDREGENAEDSVRPLRAEKPAGGSPSRRRPDEQRPDEPGSSVPVVSPGGTQGEIVFGGGLRESFLQSGLLFKALSEIQKIRESFDEVQRQIQAATVGDVIRATVGGGHMGHPLASLNEACYPEKLINPIISALTNPGDLIADPFNGSGTTCAAALKLGRSAIGLDNRASQLTLASARIIDATGISPTVNPCPTSAQ